MGTMGSSRYFVLEDLIRVWFGEFLFDIDGDGVTNNLDNCVHVPNSGQEDEDGVGNACDNGWTVANANQKDTDLDGIGDVCDSAGGGCGRPTRGAVAPVFADIALRAGLYRRPGPRGTWSSVSFLRSLSSQ